MYGGRKNPNLLVFEAGSDVSQLLVDPEPFLLFVLTIADVTDEDGETSHPRQGHVRVDPAGERNPLRLSNR
ncbi:AP-2 complex subunit alpha-2 [Senna tora]|uniref:AP-2 complex subunit alpha-2 n=1 Tax=Senna tora TaxID=362788 RepID=A0A834TSV3_9FABA|nr:AP-2 complex subunit alpha-2 [Senna tora]